MNPISFESFPQTDLCYFTNTLESAKGTPIALSPKLIDSVFVIKGNYDYTGLFNEKNGYQWTVAEDFDTVMRRIAEKRK